EALFLRQKRASEISWATATEWESSHFEIERSMGATDDFKNIGAVAAMGWKDSITEYEFIDEDLPLFGGNLLYRIKQVDINETYAYSDVMSIHTPEVELTKGVWRAYPNPTHGDQLRIGLLDKSQYDAEKISFRLIHPTVQSQVTNVDSEAEMNEALVTMTGHIPKGVFVVEIQWGQKVQHIKVLKP
ncbi:MAG TPA: T9SS type A sorting domain-containing protein, partial [Lunatimonas sp.]|nr:T9SS type A sorting domain-containing protein [Lunatimonas sp.]